MTGTTWSSCTASQITTVQFPEDKVPLVRSTVTMSGASAVLVNSDTSRVVVIVCNALSNANCTIDPTGGVLAANTGLPLGPGGVLTISGVEAQAAMTQMGGSGQLLTIYTG